MPGKLNYGSGGVGSLAHLSAEAFRFAAGIDYVHVPYKGAPDIVLACSPTRSRSDFRPCRRPSVRPSRAACARSP